MVQIGRFNRLKVIKQLDIGVGLDAGGWGDILVPKRYVPEQCQVGDELEVFIYLDSEDRLIATNQRPKAQAGEFAWLSVVSVSRIGAFLDWGLPKDLLVPFAEQKAPMEVGKSYLVRVFVDSSNRLAGSTKIDRFLDDTGLGLKPRQEVRLLIADRTELGIKDIVNHRYWGLLYQNEVFRLLRKGQRVKGYIKRIREDGKLELSLEKPGYAKVEGIAQQILDKLQASGGFLPVSDNSTPEQVQAHFGISKKAFKQAIGALYKQQLIVIEEQGIRLPV